MRRRPSRTFEKERKRREGRNSDVKVVKKGFELEKEEQERRNSGALEGGVGE